MASRPEAETTSDKRRFVRTPSASDLTCVRRDGVRMAGRCFDVGRGGMAVAVGAPMPVGTHLLVCREGLGGRAIELKTQVVWCAFDETIGTWRMGLRVYLAEPDTVDMIGELVFLALQEAGALFPAFRSGGAEECTDGGLARRGRREAVGERRTAYRLDWITVNPSEPAASA
mgnify:CR=1 FL=1